jgi:UDP-N-acetylmuramoylalanine--D-glutamate ligase
MMTALTNQRATIIGMAREGTALARFLANKGAKVTISDLRGVADLATEIGQLAGLPIQCVLRGHPDDILETDVVYVSPGVPRTIPILQKAQTQGVPLSSVTELLFQLSPAPIVGITGSSGKTTTTTLIGELLKTERRRKVWVGGNIGRPLIEEIPAMRPKDRVVLELSSFQLEPLRYSPDVAVVTNLRPNHLDRHASYEEYKEAKAQILRHQDSSHHAVLNWDDPEVRAMVGMTKAEVHWFSRLETLKVGACVVDGWVVVNSATKSTKIVKVSEIALPGTHNLENVLAAVTVAFLMGIPARRIARVVAGFKGVEHRLETVAVQGGVKWVNDSIATSPDRTVAALHAYPEGTPVVLLAGGRDKHLPMAEMAVEIVKRVKHLIVFGEMADLVQEAVLAARAKMNGSGRDVPMTVVKTLAEAVAEARNVTTNGDVVLLSPAGTSFDAYKDFAERGDHFRQLVGRKA